MIHYCLFGSTNILFIASIIHPVIPPYHPLLVNCYYNWRRVHLDKENTAFLWISCRCMSRLIHLPPSEFKQVFIVGLLASYLRSLQWLRYQPIGFYHLQERSCHVSSRSERRIINWKYNKIKTSYTTAHWWTELNRKEPFHWKPGFCLEWLDVQCLSALKHIDQALVRL